MEKPSLESPLIPDSSGVAVPSESEIELRTEGEFLSELKKQLWLAGPLIVGNLLQYAIQIISVMFVGHLGELALAGASMATSFAGVTGFSLLMGMASALDTLSGQAFGAKKYHMLGVHMQRAMLVLTLVSVPVAVIWFYAGKILMFFGQDPEIANEAGLYARWMIPSIFAVGLLHCHIRFLQTQNVVFPIMLSSGITVLFHVFVCWILVYKSGLGNKGAALANGISYWTNLLLLALYVRLSPACEKTWVGFSREALHDILNFVKLAIPSAIMVCLESGSFEMMVLLSGLLPNPRLETSVLSISLNTSSTIFMLSSGIGAAVSTRVSNELGAGRPHAARMAVKVVVFMAITEDILVGLTMILVRGIWGYAYSNEEEVVEYLATMMPILTISCTLDAIQIVLSGVARGCGWQKLGAYVNLGAYYIVGIPSAVFLAFVLRIGGKGLWMGLIGGISVELALLSIIVIRTNWEKEAKKARERVINSGMPTDLGHDGPTIK